MKTIFSDGRWLVVLRVVNALSVAGFVTKTDTRGASGVYSVAVDMRECVAARRVIASLELWSFVRYD